MNPSQRPAMRALRSHVRGAPETLAVEHVAVPRPEADEVLVEVHAAAITFDELTWEETWSRDGVDRTPIIAAHEVSGVVAALGKGASSWSAGDDVYGLIPFDIDDAAADYVVLPATCLAGKPAGLSHPEAAAVPLAGLTALQGLTSHAALRSKDRLLVQGGAGGVGAFAVQLGQAMGAHVTATAHSRNHDLLHGLGADQVVAIGDDPEDGFDAMFDTVGGAVLEQSVRATRPGGTVVTLSAPPPPGLGAAADVRVAFFVVTPDAPA